MRQLVAFQRGARASRAAEPMRPVVAQLQIDDTIAVAAFVARQAP